MALRKKGARKQAASKPKRLTPVESPPLITRKSELLLKLESARDGAMTKGDANKIQRRINKMPKG